MQQIADWLEKLGMSEYAQRFAEHRVDFSALSDLTDADLRDLGVVLGDRRKILRAIAGVGDGGPAAGGLGGVAGGGLRGYSFEASVETRYLLNEPTLAPQTVSTTSVFGLFLIRNWRF